MEAGLEEFSIQVEETHQGRNQGRLDQVTEPEQGQLRIASVRQGAARWRSTAAGQLRGNAGLRFHEA